MKRLLAAFTTALVLLSILPGSVAADPVTKFDDHHVGIFCEVPIDGGFAFVFIDRSSAFGDAAGAEVWLDPDVPSEDPPTLSGNTATAEIVEGPTQIELSATFAVFDADRVPQGTAVLEATMTPVGAVEPIEQPPGKSNHHSKTTGTFQAYQGSATLTLPGLEAELTPCFGDVTDISLFETNPRSFVSQNDGVLIDCFWETEDAVAAFFAIQDGFGFFADAFLATVDQELTGMDEFSGSLTVGSVTATIGLIDRATDEVYSATAAASFEPLGSPVTSTLVGSTFRSKATEQALVPSGQIDFSTGHSFVIDQEHCTGVEFANHAVSTQPAGPKPGGAVPVNDTPAGAIEVSPGDRFNVQTGGASVEPEEPITTCPEGIFDDFGRTLWYTIEGTGGPVTIDTAGSNFDTLIGVYQPDGDALMEVACIDDVFRDPVGSSFQAALTIDTVEGVTYYVQVGGFTDFFSDVTQFGRLRLRFS
jgi:hypothetical protein